MEVNEKIGDKEKFFSMFYLIISIAGGVIAALIGLEVSAS